MKYSKSFYIWAAATLLCMGAIFAFSSFDGEMSDAQSNLLTLLLFGSDEAAEGIRVFAHFFIFAVLGFLAANTLGHLLAGKKLFLAALCFSSVYALTDEVHQYFVPGRAFQVSDWAVDTAGALLGIGIVFIAGSVRKKIEKARTEASS